MMAGDRGKRWSSGVLPVRTTAIVVTAGEPRPVSRNRRITTMIASCKSHGREEGRAGNRVRNRCAVAAVRTNKKSVKLIRSTGAV
jgi:hypothetical protein